MKRETINSWSIKSIGYWIFSSKLEIEFDSGEIKQFKKVPSHIFDWFKSSKNCFEYYENNIKSTFNFNLIEDKF